MTFNTTIKKLLARIAAFLFLVCFAAKAVANSDQIEVAYIVGDFSIQDLTSSNNLQFANFGMGKNIGFLDEPIWFRITVKSSFLEQSPYLTISPVHLDNIAVWGKSRASSYEEFTQILSAGDTVSSPRSILPSGYSVQVTSYMLEHPIFVRIDSKNVLQPIFEVTSVSEESRVLQFMLLLFSVGAIFTLLYLAWAVGVLFSYQQPLLFGFILRQLAFLGTLAIHSGVFRYTVSGDVLPPQDYAHNLSALGYITLAQVFDYLLLRGLYQHRVTGVFLAVVVATSVAKFSFFATGDISGALQVNNASALATLALGLLLLMVPQQTIKNQENLSMSRAATGAYFLLQAIPLLVLVTLSVGAQTTYSQAMQFAFMNYAIVPGGFVVVMLFRHQKRLARERHRYANEAKELAVISQAEQAKRLEMRRLLETLAHEIKTPLTTLKMAQAVDMIDADLLRRSIDIITQVLSQVERVELIENDEVSVSLAEMDLTQLVQEVIRDAGENVLVTGKAAKLTSDWNILYLIILNLLSNAVKYKTNDGDVQVSIHSDKAGVTLRVSNPIKLAIRNPEKLFEKYYRDPSGHRESGTGLGLYLAKALTKRLGGTLVTTSTEQVFAIELQLPTRL